MGGSKRAADICLDHFLQSTKLIHTQPFNLKLLHIQNLIEMI